MIRAELRRIWGGHNAPFLLGDQGTLGFQDIDNVDLSGLESVLPGHVVCLIGDFDSTSLMSLIELLDRGAIVAPLTMSTAGQHKRFFDIVQPDFIVKDGEVRPYRSGPLPELLRSFARTKSAGLILFTSGTTGEPKAILHDFRRFLDRYSTPRPSLRTLSFLLFDHIGGLNTLFHTLFNRGQVVSLKDRSIRSVLETCNQYDVELLPTTPTFLRMLFLSGQAADLSRSLRVITYGTERMDQRTLSQISSITPWIDYRQTYGMSELGILRVKSEARDSLWIKVGGEGVETKVEAGLLHIRASGRMLGYVNAPYPFDGLGWYNTGDTVEEKGDWIRITGRQGGIANVAGLKFAVSEVEDIALQYPGVRLAKATRADNPITGHHVELLVEFDTPNDNLHDFKTWLGQRLPRHMMPSRIKSAVIDVSPRFKRM